VTGSFTGLCSPSKAAICSGFFSPICHFKSPFLTSHLAPWPKPPSPHLHICGSLLIFFFNPFFIKQPTCGFYSVRAGGWRFIKVLCLAKIYRWFGMGKSPTSRSKIGGLPSWFWFWFGSKKLYF
jgi:hypothetical protein